MNLFTDGPAIANRILNLLVKQNELLTEISAKLSGDLPHDESSCPECLKA